MYVNYHPQSLHPVSLLWAVLLQNSKGCLAYSTPGLGLLIDSLATYSLSQESQKCQKTVCGGVVVDRMADSGGRRVSSLVRGTQVQGGMTGWGMGLFTDPIFEVREKTGIGTKPPSEWL